MSQFNMTSTLLRRTVSQIALVLTFVVALASAPLFARAVSSKPKTTADESSGSALELILPRTSQHRAISESRQAAHLPGWISRSLSAGAYSAFAVHRPCV